MFFYQISGQGFDQMFGKVLTSVFGSHVQLYNYTGANNSIIQLYGNILFLLALTPKKLVYKLSIWKNMGLLVSTTHDEARFIV